MKTVRAVATTIKGEKVRGRITTSHSASDYGYPVFVDDNENVLYWFEIEEFMTTEMQVKGGSQSTPAKRKAAQENGKKGGRPPKAKKETD